jgi:hypothetical protein
MPQGRNGSAPDAEAPQATRERGMALPEFSISDWQQGMARGEWTSAGLIEGFPSRIAELDFAGQVKTIGPHLAPTF